MKSEMVNPNPSAQTGPPIYNIGVIAWIKENLLSTWYNTILTIVSIFLIYYSLSGLFNWGILNAVFRGADSKACQGIDGACWAVIGALWQLFMVGLYPYQERYRIALVLALLAVMSLLAIFPGIRKKRSFQITWLILPIPLFFLVRGGDFLGLKVVDTNLWGGLLLTVILSVVGIIAAFPIGIAMALGRRSKMPIIRALSIVYIELIRGVPLITLLFISSVLLPLFFHEGFDLDKVLRVQIFIILFAGAYLAEIVRGGLQGLDSGQEEAAAALGLNYWQTMTFIIMPQALRIVIPPMVSQFISLLKDTSLVTIIGLFDLLAITSMASSNIKWVGKVTEPYVFVAAIYWVMCFSMSRYARRLELKYQKSHR